MCVAETVKLSRTEALLGLIRSGEKLSFGNQLRLTLALSVPAILAQLSAIAMQYIDASMVGSLGAEASASIGLVSTTTWLFWGFLSAAAMGFSVQVAHLIGAGKMDAARSVLRQSLTAVSIFGLAVGALGVAISGPLPGWLGGDESIRSDASGYFLIFSAFLPVLQVSFLAGGMLRCAGNMKVPSVLNILMCVLDVVLNFLFIFPSRSIHILGVEMDVWGAGMGVRGAALATVLAETIVAVAMLWYVMRRSEILRWRPGDHGYWPRWMTIKRAFNIGAPMGIEHVAMCGAQILVTVIVAPLGVVAIAANAFAVIAESLCYMPGYGISEAATTLAGQCHGAGRYRLMRRFGTITVVSGMVIMGVLGIGLYYFALPIMSVMSPVEAIRTLGAECLRIEAWAEPMFAASIVVYGYFVGLGRTVMPCVVNLGSIWCVRLTLAAFLAPTMGLRGVWIAMCVELCFRGLMFLVLLWREYRKERKNDEQH